MNLLTIDSKRSLGLIPCSDQKFHIIGIGGIGMSAIASILHLYGLKVQGSDLSENLNIERLKSSGIKCFIGHSKKNISDVDAIIISTAIRDDNEEIIEAKRLKKVILSRAEILNHIIYNSYNICISGMHGKTTTSSMIALVFEYAKLKNLSMIGGIMEYNKSNYIVHKDFQWSIIEADESDDTFIKIPSSVSVITNISPEHLDYHLTFENIKRKFKKFIDLVPFFGFSVICAEDVQMRDFIFEIKEESSKKIITYAVSDFLNEEWVQNSKLSINYMAKNIVMNDLNNLIFDVFYDEKFLEKFELNIFGKFNISNALAVIAVSNELKIDLKCIKDALKNFKSTKRRFDIIGTIFENILLVDDYAHHPKEINANIETALVLAKKRNGKLIVIIQPHRYSRVQKLFDSFVKSKLCEVNVLGIMPIYSAGEDEIKGISSKALCEKIKENVFIKKGSNSEKSFVTKDLKSFDDMNDFIKKNVSKNDIVIFMGAGDINKIAYDFFNLNNSVASD